MKIQERTLLLKCILCATSANPGRCSLSVCTRIHLYFDRTVIFTSSELVKTSEKTIIRTSWFHRTSRGISFRCGLVRPRLLGRTLSTGVLCHETRESWGAEDVGRDLSLGGVSPLRSLGELRCLGNDRSEVEGRFLDHVICGVEVLQAGFPIGSEGHLLIVRRLRRRALTRSP